MRRTAVVTGATSGIGLAAAKALAARGIRVIGVGRDPGRAEAAKREVLAAAADAGSDAEAAYVIGELSSTDGVRRLAADLRDRLEADGGRLDILVHAAGTVSSWHIATSEAYELQFAVNHLAPFLLTHELLPCLRAAGASGQGAPRVLLVSSKSHYHTRIRWGDIMMRRHYHCLAAYKQSKLCNVLFAAELARREAVEALPVRTYAVDPGLVATSIGLKGTSGIERLVWRLRMRAGTPPDVPGGEIARIATEPAYDARTGRYWFRAREKTPSRTARDPEQAARLWRLSERLCGIAPEAGPAE